MMKTFMRAISCVAVASLALTVSACSSGGSGTPGTSAGGGDGELLIGFVTPTASETYWTSYVSGVEQRAKELGVKIQITDGQNDANTQLEQVNSLIASGVDGIVLTPVDTMSLKSAPGLADDAGIPLITSNRALDTGYGNVNGASPKLHVGFNDVAMGEVQGELVADICEGVDPCEVAMVLQPLGSTPQIERSEGFQNVISKHPNIKVVAEQSDNNDANTAMDVTTTILQQQPNLHVIASQYDPSAVAVAKAVSEAGRSGSIEVVGVGGSKDGIEAVKSGALNSTVWISPSSDGRMALETMVALLRGTDLPADVQVINNRPTVPVELIGVNKDNVADHPGEW